MSDRQLTRPQTRVLADANPPVRTRSFLLCQIPCVGTVATAWYGYYRLCLLVLSITPSSPTTTPFPSLPFSPTLAPL